MSHNLAYMRVFLLLLVSNVVFSAAPAFQCKSEGQSVNLILEKTGNRLEVQEGSKNRTIPLSAPNAVFAESIPADWLVYHETRPGGFNLGQEVRIKYSTEKTGSTADLLIWLDHKALLPLKCTPAKTSFPVKTDFDSATLERLLAEQFNAVTAKRSKMGQLEKNALAMAEELIARMKNHRPEKLPALWIPPLKMDLLKLHKSSVASISERLSGTTKVFWQDLLKSVQYDYFPESERYLIWIKEGTRPSPQRHLPSISAALNGFVRLSAFRSEDLKKHFASEAKLLLKTVQENELPVIRNELTAPAKNFFDELWNAATGKKTLANYPVLEEIIANLKKVVEKKGSEFDPQTVEKKAMAFFRSSLAQDEEAKRLFLEYVRPLFKDLTPRQLEDLMSWVEEDDKPLFEQLVN